MILTRLSEIKTTTTCLPSEVREKIESENGSLRQSDTLTNSTLVRLRRDRGTSEVRYRCSVPGLAGFAASRLHGFRSLIRNCRLPICDCRSQIQSSIRYCQLKTYNRKSQIENRKCHGGEGGIRTHGTVSRTQHFQCCQFSHSCTSPKDFRLRNCRLTISNFRFSDCRTDKCNRQSPVRQSANGQSAITNRQYV